MELTTQQQKRIKKVGLYSEDKDLAHFDVMQDIADALDKLAGADTLRIQGKKGDKGDKGDRGEAGKNGKDGKDGKDGVDGKDGKDGEMGVIDEATIGYLQDEIKRLNDKVEESEKKLSERISSKQGGFRASNATRFYDLSSQADGVTKVFTVPKGISAIVICSDFPTILMEGNGFTLNATRTQLTLTVENAPSTGSQLLYQYSSMFNI